MKGYFFMSNHNIGKAVIFDFGGVLVDWNAYYLFRKLLPDDQKIARFLQETNFYHWNLELQRGRIPFCEGVNELAERFPQYRQLIEAFHLRWQEALGMTIDGTFQILKKIKEAGYLTYGLSNWPAEKFDLYKDRFEFLNYLDDYIISGRVYQIKPEKEIFLTLLNKIDQKAKNCVFIDDAPENIDVAKELGFNTILYKSPAQLRGELSLLRIILK
jgi:2-haloacid dehalogenase